MTYAGAVRAIAIGVLSVVVTACGGGGGSGGDGGPGLTNESAIPLPDIERATQKTLSRENAQQALLLASNFAEFIDNSAPYPVLAGGDAASGKSRQAQKLREGTQVVLAAVDVSQEVCVSGQATGEEVSPTKVSIRFLDCNVGDAIYDGVMVQEEIDPLPAGIAFYEITTFDGLRITAADQSLDVIFDGKVEVLMSDMQFGEEGESGTINASLDIRDLLEQKGASLREYESRFEIVATPSGGLAVDFIGRSGTIYDENDEYFALGATDPGSDAAMFLSSNIIEYASLQQAIRYMINTYPEKVGLSLHGLDSDLYAYEDASSDGVRLQLDLPPDTCGAVNVVGGGLGVPYPHAFPFAPACYLRVDLNELAVAQTNDFAPVINLAGVSTTVMASQYFVIPHLDVTDADQQFVSISWELVSKPEGAAPLYFSWNDGFLFASSIAGIYEFRITASDGIHATEQIFPITVTY